MEEGFEEWAEEHNIDLTAVSEYGITYVQHWRWGLED